MNELEKPESNSGGGCLGGFGFLITVAFVLFASQARAQVYDPTSGYYLWDNLYYSKTWVPACTQYGCYKPGYWYYQQVAYKPAPYGITNVSDTAARHAQLLAIKAEQGRADNKAFVDSVASANLRAEAKELGINTIGQSRFSGSFLIDGRIGYGVANGSYAASVLGVGTSGNTQYVHTISTFLNAFGTDDPQFLQAAVARNTDYIAATSRQANQDLSGLAAKQQAGRERVAAIFARSLATEGFLANLEQKKASATIVDTTTVTTPNSPTVTPVPAANPPGQMPLIKDPPQVQVNPRLTEIASTNCIQCHDRGNAKGNFVIQDLLLPGQSEKAWQYVKPGVAKCPPGKPLSIDDAVLFKMATTVPAQQMGK